MLVVVLQLRDSLQGRGGGFFLLFHSLALLLVPAYSVGAVSKAGCTRKFPHIYKEAKAGNQINDKLTVTQNEPFQTTIQQDPYEGQTAPQVQNTIK